MNLKTAFYMGLVASSALVLGGCADTDHRRDHGDRYNHAHHASDQSAPHRMDPRLHQQHGYATGHLAEHHDSYRSEHRDSRRAERRDDDRDHDNNRDHDSDRTAGDRLEDTAITTKVKAALLREKGIRSSAIKVETFEGVVQLSGFVNSKWQITRSGEVAAAVEGVRRVKNDLIHKPKNR